MFTQILDTLVPLTGSNAPLPLPGSTWTAVLYVACSPATCAASIDFDSVPKHRHRHHHLPLPPTSGLFSSLPPTAVRFSLPAAVYEANSWLLSAAFNFATGLLQKVGPVTHCSVGLDLIAPLPQLFISCTSSVLYLSIVSIVDVRLSDIIFNHGVRHFLPNSWRPNC